MHKRMFLLTISLLPIISCAYSGHLIGRQETGPGGAQYRAGTISYRNDSKAERRKSDAERKIAKFCGSESYTITKEGASVSAGDLSELEFRCGQSPSPVSAQPASSAVSTQAK